MQHKLIVVQFRITPACAGSTINRGGEQRENKDHPRLRGEYQARLSRQLLTIGSPPLARGVHLRRFGRQSQIRITPACAGSTMTAKTIMNPAEDHPRLRGEYFQKEILLSLILGSPPLARGVLP